MSSPLLNVLDTIEADGAIGIRASASVGASETALLAGRLIAICQGLTERPDPPRCVVLRSVGDAFFVAPPASARDCDAPNGLGAQEHALPSTLPLRESESAPTSVSEITATAEAGRAGTWRRAVSAVAALPWPTLAVLEGDAIGASLELALACDVRIAADTVNVGASEIHWGRMPSAGGTQRLVRAVGQTTAMRLLLTGEILSASDAMAAGLIHRMTPAPDLAAFTKQLIGQICTAAPIAAAYTKESIRIGSEVPLTHGLRVEADLAALLQTTDDRVEGLAAFLAHRLPRFQGR